MYHTVTTSHSDASELYSETLSKLFSEKEFRIYAHEETLAVFYMALLKS